MILVSTFIFKYAIFLIYLFLYFYILIMLISYIFCFNLVSSKYISELKTLGIYMFDNFILFIIMAFSGLPPFFFFFNKYSLISTIFINNFIILSILCLILLFLSWFIYFSAIRYIILAKDDNNVVNYSFYKKYSSFLSIFLFFNFFFLLFGFFFLFDIFIYIYYIFL